MRKKIYRNIEIPEGVEVKVDGNKVEIKGKEGEISKNLNLRRVNLEVNEKEIKIGHDKATKKEKKIINTTYAHLANMIKGVQEKFEYQLKICSSHFPMTVSVEGKEFLIKNFLGEKIPRKSKIVGNCECEVDGETITIKSVDREAAGQTAANLEKITRITGKDRRIFQDGIFIINKAGKEL